MIKMMIKEIWKTAVYDGEIYEELYKVSNLGRILSLNYNRTGKAELLKPDTDKDGYLQVYLRKDRKGKWCKVHRLVAQTFLPNPENKPTVDHIDRNKLNNFVGNLRWADIELQNNNRDLSTISKTVLQYTLDGEFIREWPSTQECGRNGFSQQSVSACCRGKQKSHKGFIWKYS